MTASQCNRFEEQGLEALLSGASLMSAHFDDCAVCRQARGDYERVMLDLSRLYRDLKLPAGWQGLVWSDVREARASRESEEPTRRSRRRFRRLVPVTLAAGLVGWLFLAPDHTALKSKLEQNVKRSALVYRSGDMVRPGDTLEIRADTGDRVEAALRVYVHDSRLYLDCNTDPSCRTTEGEIAADVRLDHRGSYRTILLLSDEPLPESTGDMEEDLKMAFAHGADVLSVDPVEVR